MKKLGVLIAGLLLGTVVSYAATTPKKLTITNTRIVQAVSQDVTEDYEGVKIFVPKGQTVLLGLRSDGMIVIRGNNLQNVRIDDASLSSNGYSVLSYQPQSQVIFLNRGTDLTVLDAMGTTATIYPGQAASTTDARVTSVTAPQLQAAAAAEAALEAAVTEDVPDFVAESEMSEAASEQATQDVKESETILSSSVR